MDFRPHLQVLEYQLQHQNNNCLCTELIGLLAFFLSMFKHLSIQTILLPIMNPLPVHA